ncbi:CusA/CzcA family heavy metal efflux RND transporter [Sphingomonas sp. MA1305]|jgi:cobalt-zinc-cadmium resistance protein CzcA|uniref:efflux RND transporter permease subunit n=1 Tax=Sphingomonas sp. MA1305 TaxID=2479204 RepID=UPI0018DFA517|nr:CusA/CzcA family heavy metal efflux RND transporter [Sphingomonas sp. MA1305]MBI0477083.1 CusA/CzcA family heavy metal efflux RND transporter [Sphingomonas sp. MA1305]
MIANLMALSVRARWAVLALFLVVAGVGVWQLTKLPIDAVPDITNKQVQINTIDPRLSPVEIEKLVTYPVEISLAGIPGLETTRSISRNGFSQVTAIFTDKTDLYFARQQVGERLRQATDRLPDGVQPQIGPVTTGLGEILMYTVGYANPDGKGARKVAGQPGWQPDGSYLTPEGERLTDPVAKAGYLRTVQDWIVSPQLRAVQGVAGVDSIGGFAKTFVVEPDPVKLSSFGISYAELGQALENANLAVGANYYNRGGEAYLVRVDSRVRTVDQIQNAVAATRGGVPITIGQIANVKIGGDLRTGAGSLNGQEAVIGTVLMLIGENSRIVAEDASKRLDQIAKSLPPGVQVKVVLDRAKLVSATVGTVERNLTEGAILVAVSLFLLLGNWRAALIAVLVIPFSFLMMAMGMNVFGVPGNLMSLGALDFGLIVDGAVIIIENCLARLAHRQEHEGRLLSLRERLEETMRAAQEMIKPTVFGQAIILLAFAPLLMFTGVEGKTFSPMAITIMLALVAAFVLAITLVPALVAILIRGKVAEKDVWLIRKSKERYLPLLDKAIAKPWPFILGGLAFFLAAIPAFGLLGSEFIPQLDEKNLALASTRVPSVSLEQSLAMQREVEAAVKQLPEVETMFSKTGTAEVATDPMPPNVSDGFVILKPQEEWPDGVKTKADAIARIEKAAGGQLGNLYEVSQPIQLRFNELIAGVRGDVAIKLYGDDLDLMSRTANEMVRVLQGIPGAASVKADQVGGAPTLDIKLDRAAIARLGLTVRDVSDTIAAALGGRESGLVYEGDRRFDVTVRVPEATRANLDDIRSLPVLLPAVEGRPRSQVPLAQVAQIRLTEGLNQVSRENGKRRVVVQVNLAGRDAGSFVQEAQAKIGQLKLPAGYYLEWGGQFESLAAATSRLSIVVPLCFLAIFGLLYLALGGFGRAAAVFLAVPLGLAGGVFTLALTGINFSVSAAVGFICLAGVAVLNGLVVMTEIRRRSEDGLPLAEAIREGMREKMRAVVMTGFVPAIGFVPMALAHGTGAEVQKPLATTVIGGLIAATILTLLVLPAIATVVLGRFGGAQARDERRDGDVPAEAGA